MNGMIAGCIVPQEHLDRRHTLCPDTSCGLERVV